MTGNREILNTRKVSARGRVILPDPLRNEKEVVFELNESKECVVRANKTGDAS